MKILYHHRTRATDAQRVHIREMIHAFRKLGHQVNQAALADAEAPQADATREVSDGFLKKLIRRIPFSSEALQLGYNAFATPWLLAKIFSQNADLVYERYSLFTFAGVFAARLSGRPIVIEVNSPLALELSRDKEIRSGRFAHWCERTVCNLATKVIVVSGPLKRILMANGVREDKLVLMPNGVNLEHFNGAAEATVIREKLGIAPGATVIGFVGWFRKWHGLDFLVRSFEQAQLKSRGAVLLLVGDGPAADDLKQYVAEHKLEKSVLFTGPIAHEKIPPYLHLIDIAVQPAANEYCCPMKIIEYMGLGKPVVGPRQENIEELLADGQQALLFTPGDEQGMAQAMRRLVEDKELRRKMGKEAFATIQRRGMLWEKNAERVVNFA